MGVEERPRCHGNHEEVGWWGIQMGGGVRVGTFAATALAAEFRHMTIFSHVCVYLARYRG